MFLETEYRRFQPLRVAKGTITARSTFTESLAVAQVEPEGTEVTRAGRRFRIAYNGTVPTGIAPVQAFPTTAAQWVIWNGDQFKSYIFTNIGLFIFSGTQGVGGVVLGCFFNTPDQTALAQATGLGVQNMGAGAIGSKAVIKSAVTITAPATPLWVPLSALAESAGTVGAKTSSLGDIKGKLILPPKTGLGLVALSAAGTTPLFLPYGDWIELETDQE